MEVIFGLLIAFQAKHFIADYPLQNKFMLGKFKSDWGFLLPLIAHCLVHAGMTFTIIAPMPNFGVVWGLKMAAIDFVIHFVMDRIKAGPKYLGRYKDMYDKKFWWALGFDQMIHHFTHYLIIYLVIAEIVRLSNV